MTRHDWKLTGKREYIGPGLPTDEYACKRCGSKAYYGERDIYGNFMQSVNWDEDCNLFIIKQVQDS